jgi:hypothetical protein
VACENHWSFEFAATVPEMSSIYIPEKTKAKVRADFQNRCAYCLSLQRYVYGPFEIEHIIPVFLGGSNEEKNLCLSCRFCNSYKGIQIIGLDPLTQQSAPLFNPRTQSGTIIFVGVGMESLLSAKRLLDAQQWNRSI